jgi:hypothetical protein
MADLFSNLPGVPLPHITPEEVSNSNGGYQKAIRMSQLQAFLPAIPPQQMDRVIELALRYQEYIARVTELAPYVGNKMQLDFIGCEYSHFVVVKAHDIRGLLPTIHGGSCQAVISQHLQPEFTSI